MYVGNLKNVKISGFCRAGTNIPFEPVIGENGEYIWSWDRVYDIPFDVNISLGKKSYIGAVALKLADACVHKIDVMDGMDIIATHTAETNALTGGNIVIPVGYSAKKFGIRIYPALKATVLSEVEVLGACDDGKPLVWPSPKKISFQKSTVRIGAIDSFGEDPDEVRAAEFLRERLTEKHGENYIRDDGVRVIFKKENYKDERYTVKFEGGKFILSAGSRISLLYAADTLLQISKAGGVRIFGCDDAPSKKLRGLHIGLPSKNNFDFAKKLFKYIFIPLRFNTLFLEFVAGMRFDRHPEITAAYLDAIDKSSRGLQPPLPHSSHGANYTVLEKDDVRELVAYIKGLGINIIPEVQSLGHVQYITYAHPEIAEREENEVVVKDTREEDKRPESFYHHSYCPSNEESYRIIFDIIDEIVEVVKPQEYVHIGHDEIYQIGLCPKCRERGAAAVYAEHVTRLHDYLKAKGLKTVIWSDMLHGAPTTRYQTAAAIDMIPKDVLLLDFIWYFHTGRDIEDELLSHGYTLAIGNLYSSHFTRYSSRIAKAGVIGGQVSTWVATAEKKFSDNGKFYDMMYLSQMLWNPESYDERNRRTYADIIAKHIQPQMRAEIRGLPTEYKERTPVSLPRSRAPLPRDVKRAFPKVLNYSGEVIGVNEYCAAVEFVHATLYPAPKIAWADMRVIGKYEVTYDDLTKEDIELRYASNITVYTHPYGEPLREPYYRHNGYIGTYETDPLYQAKGENGRDIVFSSLKWQNPHPEKKIVSVKYVRTEDDYCGILIKEIEVLR